MKDILKYFRKISGFSYAFGFQVLERIFYFAFFLILARTFSVAEYGEVILVFTVHNVLLAVFNFGLPVLIQKGVSSDRNNAGRQITYFLCLNSFTSALYLFSSAILYYSAFPSVNTLLYTAISLSVIISSYLNLIVSVNYGLFNLKYQFHSIFIVRSTTIIIILFYIISGNANVIFFIALLGISNFISWFILFSNLKSIYKFAFTGIPAINDIRNILKTAYPLALISVINFLYTKIDVLLISRFLDNENISYYNVGYGVFTASQLFFGFVLTGGFSEVSSYNKKVKAVRLFFLRYAKMITVISVLITASLFFAGGIFIHIVWGGRYTSSSGVLSILAFALIPLSLNNLAGIILNGLDMFKQNLTAISLGLAINVISNLYLINLFGIKGAAISTIITEIVILTADLYFLLPVLFRGKLKW